MSIKHEEKEKKNNSVVFDAKSIIWMSQFIYLFLVFPIVMTLVILSISEGFPPPPSSLLFFPISVPFLIYFPFIC